MGLDIRIPLGLIFLITGGMMSVYGLITRGNAAIYEKSMGINLNLTWGARHVRLRPHHVPRRPPQEVAGRPRHPAPLGARRSPTPLDFWLVSVFCGASPTLATMRPSRRWGTRFRGWGRVCIPPFAKGAKDGAPGK